MDVLFAAGQATAREIHAGLPDPPSYSAVRAQLRILEEKGHVEHIRRGRRYVYHPVRSRRAEGKDAMGRVLRTFFDGQVEKAMVAMLDASDGQLSDDEYNRLRDLIDRARQEGR